MKKLFSVVILLAIFPSLSSQPTFSKPPSKFVDQDPYVRIAAEEKSYIGNTERGIIGDEWADIVLGQPDFSQITPNEVVGNHIAKYQAMKLSKMLMAYDFDRRLNPFAELGGFIFTFEPQLHSDT